MKTITSDPNLVAYCGLYCGSCRSYLKESCPGCHENKKASWCEIRTCCMKNDYKSCADCKEFQDPKDCKKYNNFISKIIGFVLHSDRSACIKQIKNVGLESHAQIMSSEKKSTIKKG